MSYYWVTTPCRLGNKCNKCAICVRKSTLTHLCVKMTTLYNDRRTLMVSPHDSDTKSIDLLTICNTIANTRDAIYILLENLEQYYKNICQKFWMAFQYKPLDMVRGGTAHTIATLFRSIADLVDKSDFPLHPEKSTFYRLCLDNRAYVIMDSEVLAMCIATMDLAEQTREYILHGRQCFMRKRKCAFYKIPLLFLTVGDTRTQYMIVPLSSILDTLYPLE